MKTMYSDNNLRQRGNVKAVLCFGDFADLIKSLFHIWKEGLVLTLPGVRDKSLYKLKVIFGLEKSTLKILVWENVYKEKRLSGTEEAGVYSVRPSSEWQGLKLKTLTSFVILFHWLFDTIN